MERETVGEEESNFQYFQSFINQVLSVLLSRSQKWEALPESSVMGVIVLSLEYFQDH